MQHTLSVGLIKKIKKAIKESKPPTFYWGYRDELTPDQINLILAVPDGLSEVEMELYEGNIEYSSALEREHLKEVLGNFRREISEEIGETDGNLEAAFNDIIEEYDLYSLSPGVDMGIEALVNNSKPKVVLQFDLRHEYEGWQWENCVEYEDVKEVLRLFNINPGKLSKRFINLAHRDGREYLLPKDLKELWDNASFGGQYVIPIDLDLWDYHQNRDLYHTGIILHKGSEIWMHNYSNGSGSISIPLQKDLVIRKSKIKYFFGNDDKTTGYGLDEVYGLCHSAWKNQISPIQNEKPAVYQLPSVDKAFSLVWYGNVVTNEQTSTLLRPYNDQRTKDNGDIPFPGELMEWDIRHRLWDDFPSSGKKYLRQTANKDNGHCAFKVEELIGQVRIMRCQFIVDDKTREIVWSKVPHNGRSYDVFKWFTAKLKQPGK